MEFWVQTISVNDFHLSKAEMRKLVLSLAVLGFISLAVGHGVSLIVFKLIL